MSYGAIALVPDVQMPRRAKGASFMRGRPITGEEFERMLAAVADVRPNDIEAWQRLLKGLWMSGLRIGEALQLSWDKNAGIMVDISGRYPQLRIWAEAEKGYQDRQLPVTPDFGAFLIHTPEHERSGLVFKIGEKQMSVKRVVRVVSAIGRQAAVVVNKAAGKFASAHDLRRAFGTRWASRVKPVTLQLLMRHRTMDTTLKYYVAHEADDVAKSLWSEFGSEAPGEVLNAEQVQFDAATRQPASLDESDVPCGGS